VTTTEGHTTDAAGRDVPAEPSRKRRARVLLGAALTIGAVLFVIGTRGETHAAAAPTPSTPTSTTTVPTQPSPSSTVAITEPAPATTTTRPPEGSPAREAQERSPTTLPTTVLPPTTLPATAGAGATTSEPPTTAAAAEGIPAREAAEGASGHVETAAERSTETVLGVNLESGGIVASVVIVSIALAGLVVFRRFRAALWVATGFCALAAAADLHELRIQIDRSRTGLAVIAGSVAAIHVFGAIAGVVAAREPPPTA